MTPELGKSLMAIGVLIFFIGLGIFVKDRIPLLGSLEGLGKLPGDISIERENFKFYFPLTTSILLSLILSGIFWLVSKLK